MFAIWKTDLNHFSIVYREFLFCSFYTPRFVALQYAADMAIIRMQANLNYSIPVKIQVTNITIFYHVKDKVFIHDIFPKYVTLTYDHNFFLHTVHNTKNI